MKNHIENYSKYIIPLAVVGLIILGIIVIITTRDNSQLGQDELTQEEITSLENENLTVLEVKNQKEIVIANKKVTFDESFLVNSIVQANKVSGIECRGAGGRVCIINFVTDGETTYYISTPAEPIAIDGFNRSKDSAKLFSTPSGDMYLAYSILEIVNEAGEIQTDTTLVSQMFGCLQDTICVGSGALDITDTELNARQVAAFEEFVRSLRSN
ncbi:hypothetical protein IH575_02150 [Candidatus Dojkabacteria bacterium]|nr:hypothetical protein [Candidatus Dojkabacteria bacterium]